MTTFSRRKWLPLLLSAVAWPGAGQFLQKRPVWGMVYAVGFALFAAISFALLIPVMMDFGRALWDGRAPDPVDWRKLLRPVAVAGAVYAANLYDVWWSAVKASRPPPIPAQK